MSDTTLVFIFNGDRILLAMKKRGFGIGRWNGPGGKVQSEETFFQTAIRETQEEIGVTPVLDQPCGKITFHVPSIGSWLCMVYRTEQFSGEPTESEEMKPQWFSIDALPYQTMWSGDDKWIPYVVKNQKFEAEMWFNEQEENTKAEIRLV